MLASNAPSFDILRIEAINFTLADLLNELERDNQHIDYSNIDGTALEPIDYTPSAAEVIEKVRMYEVFKLELL